MRKVLIFGNSSSGKSTLAKSIAESESLAHLDLDEIAWLPTDPPQRAPLADSQQHIVRFAEDHKQWVVEGCYADLIEIAATHANEMIFLNLSVSDCIANARSRPWEPHKYPSKEAQDANLEMLIDWIKNYPHRDDACSQQRHIALFESFQGTKKMVTKRLHA